MSQANATAPPKKLANSKTARRSCSHGLSRIRLANTTDTKHENTTSNRKWLDIQSTKACPVFLRACEPIGFQP